MDFSDVDFEHKVVLIFNVLALMLHYAGMFIDYVHDIVVMLVVMLQAVNSMLVHAKPKVHATFIVIKMEVSEEAEDVEVVTKHASVVETNVAKQVSL